jgi:hypothetical protein
MPSSPLVSLWNPGCRQAFDEVQFHKLADETLANLHDKLDEYVEKQLDFGDVSCEVGPSMRAT